MNSPRTAVPGRIVLAGAAALLALLILVAGCGGGVGVGGTGAFASGPITGFGSIIVNGIEFDDSQADFRDEDGGPGDRTALRLGMYAEVDSGPVGGSSSAPTATATRVRISSEVVGPVTDRTGSTLVVLGQLVTVTATTVFDTAFTAGLADVPIGAVVEVHGFRDGAAIVATRVESRGSMPAVFKVRGAVSLLDPAARTFSIGAASFSYAAPPAGLAEGAIVRVKVDAQPQNGLWRVLSMGDGRRRLPDVERARLRGPITAFTSSRAFSVDGQAVDAASASFPNGEAGLALGVRVEVDGTAASGVLRATVVRIDDNGGAQGGFELKGAIESVQPASQTFVLRGVTVFYGAPALVFQDGSAADLRAGAQVEVRGLMAGGGTRLLATQVRFRR